MTSRTAEVVVIGAGIIGCAVARALAAEGLDVLVLERSGVAAESSGAAAGILAPRVHATEGAMFPLAMASHAQFGSYVAEVTAQSGMDPEYARTGVFDLAFDEEREEELRDKVKWLQGIGHDVDWLDREQVLGEEPAISPALRGAFYDADAFQVHPARLTRAVAQSAARRGVGFRFGVDVLGIKRVGSRAKVVRTTAGDVEVEQVVVATGAWTGRAGQWLELEIPVYPAKGQILTVAVLPPPIRAVVFGLDAYLLPRLDGTIVVGATVENTGFDKSMTAAGIGWLSQSLASLCPALADAPIDRIWTGLRPGSPDDLPIVCSAPGWDNVTIATGHHRNGIMLTPITAQIVSDLILRGKTAVDGAEDVGLNRFARA
jgi:glycine oxidase